MTAPTIKTGLLLTYNSEYDYGQFSTHHNQITNGGYYSHRIDTSDYVCKWFLYHERIISAWKCQWISVIKGTAFKDTVSDFLNTVLNRSHHFPNNFVHFTIRTIKYDTNCREK